MLGSFGGSGSGRIRNFFLDPELFVPDLGPANMKGQGIYDFRPVKRVNSGL